MSILEKIDKYLNEEKTYKKMVNVDGEKIKVDFKHEFGKRTVHKDNYNEGYDYFYIDGEKYKVDWVSRRGKGMHSKFSKRFFYKGQVFPDNEKKVIEYILKSERR